MYAKKYEQNMDQGSFYFQGLFVAFAEDGISDVMPLPGHWILEAWETEGKIVWSKQCWNLVLDHDP